MTELRIEALHRALEAALATCDQALRRGPEGPREGSDGWRVRAAALRRLLSVGRLPRLAAVGRRGAGKSSLANALVGAPVLGVGDVTDRTVESVWRTLAIAGRRVDWLDTPGLRAGARGRSRRAEVEASVVASPPDVLLVLCQATEVDAGVDDDLQDVLAVGNTVARETGAWPAVVGVVTKVDELAPAEVTTPPFDDPEKQAHIVAAVGLFHRHLLRSGITPVSVMPTASYVAWRGEQPAHDVRWNMLRLDGLLRALLPDGATLRGEPLREELARVLRTLGREVTLAYAKRAYAAGSSGRPGDEAELSEMEVSLAMILAALGGRVDQGGALPGEILTASRRRGAVDLMREALLGVGARRASGWMAAARVRALGRALMTLEDAGVDLETARALVPG